MPFQADEGRFHYSAPVLATAKKNYLDPSRIAKELAARERFLFYGHNLRHGFIVYGR